MYKIIKTFLFFLILVLVCLAQPSCQSSKSAHKSKSSTTGKGYVKNKSGNKRSNHRISSTPRKPSAKKSSSTTETSSKNASGDALQVINTARSYLGTPYRYGGNTSKGMDCSGLLCTSFQTIEIQLPRTSHEQANYGKEVSSSNILPGDLVFFAERKGSSKVSHVGLVTSVRAKNEIIFIHSSTSRGVVEDNLYAEYYQKIFVKAIRPF